MQIIIAAILIIVTVTGVVATPTHLGKRLDWQGVSETIRSTPWSFAHMITAHCLDRNAPGPTTCADIKISQAAQPSLRAAILPIRG
jgi:hypothetical protein